MNFAVVFYVSPSWDHTRVDLVVVTGGGEGA